MLNIGPTAWGTIDPLFEERLLALGDWLALNGESIYGTRPWPAAQNDSATPGIWYTSKSASSSSPSRAGRAHPLRERGAESDPSSVRRAASFGDESHVVYANVLLEKVTFDTTGAQWSVYLGSVNATRATRITWIGYTAGELVFTPDDRRGGIRVFIPLSALRSSLFTRRRVFEDSASSSFQNKPKANANELPANSQAESESAAPKGSETGPMTVAWVFKLENVVGNELQAYDTEQNLRLLHSRLFKSRPTAPFL